MQLSTSLPLPHECGWSWQWLADWWTVSGTFCRRAAKLHHPLFSEVQTLQEHSGTTDWPCFRRPSGIPAAVDDLNMSGCYKLGRKLCCCLIELQNLQSATREKSSLPQSEKTLLLLLAKQLKRKTLFVMQLITEKTPIKTIHFFVILCVKDAEGCYMVVHTDV